MEKKGFKIAVNQFLLTFYDKQLEKEFRDKAIENVRVIIRIAIIVGSCFFTLSSLISVKNEGFSLSGFLTPAIGILFLVFTFLKAYRKYYFVGIAITFVIGGYTAAFIALDNPDFMMFLYLRILFFTLIPFFTLRLLIFSNIAFVGGVFCILYFFSANGGNFAANHIVKLFPFVTISILAFYIKQRFERLNFLKSKEIHKRNAELQSDRKNLENQAALAKILQKSTVTSLNIPTFLQNSLAVILALPWLNILSKGSIFTTNANGDLEMIAQKDLGVLVKTCAIIKSGQCLCGKALAQKKILFNSCVTADHDIVPEGMTPHGHFNIPLIINDEVLGVLNIYVEHNHVKTKEEVDFFTLVSNTLASVLYRDKLEQEKALQAADLKRYFMAIEQSETTILFTDTKGVINYVNPHVMKVTGYSQEELVSKPVNIMGSGKTPHSVFETMWNTVRNKKTWSGEFINQKKDGTEFIEKAIISPVIDDQGEIIEYIAIKEDITELKKAAEQIVIQKQIIEKSHEKIQSSIDYAQRIQNSLLASISIIDKEFDDLIVSFLPKETVSGDFYLVKKKGNLTYVAVADCTGHGVPGAMISTLAIQELSHIFDTCNCEINGVLDILNSNVNDLLNNDNQLGSDGLDLILLCIDTNSKTIDYAGAKGIFYLHQSNELLHLRTDRVSIGQKIADDEFKFSTQRITYSEGDTVFLLTDGLIDQLSAINNKRIGSKRTIQCIEKLVTLSGEERVIHLNNFISKHVSEKQTDDMTFISFKL
ncbi:MAG: PAS domain S-box protein [Crocinitomix sp.]|nr:PAS domain S-box protein [Crocinitomix sp.]